MVPRPLFFFYFFHMGVRCHHVVRPLTVYLPCPLNLPAGRTRTLRLSSARTHQCSRTPPPPVTLAP